MGHVLARLFGAALSLALVLTLAFTPGFALDPKECDPEPTAMKLTYESPVIHCAIDPIGDVDRFKFDAAVGDNVRVVLTEVPETGNSACIEVRDPDNVEIVNICTGNGPPNATVAEFSATKPGEHRIVVTEREHDATIAYHLSITCLFGPCPPSRGIDHYKCYTAGVTKGEPKFVQRDVALADQFETKNTTVLKPVSICLPVDKNGEGIGNATDHLVCYDIKDVKGQPKFEKRDVEISNQFDDEEDPQRLTVEKADLLCVPSSKTVIP